MELIKLFGTVLFLVHWAACAFYFMSTVEKEHNAITWVDAAGMTNVKESWVLYVAAASWALSTITTVGYGDIWPVTPNEKLFATFCMVGACGVFAFIVGSIGSIIDQSSTLITDFQYAYNMF